MKENSHTMAFCTQFSDEEVMAGLKQEFMSRYQIDAQLACEMALDVFDLITVSDGNVDQLSRYF